MSKLKIKTMVIISSVWLLIGIGLGYVMYSSWSELNCNKTDLPKENKEVCIQFKTFAPNSLLLMILISILLATYSCYHINKTQGNSNVTKETSSHGDVKNG